MYESENLRMTQYAGKDAVALKGFELVAPGQRVELSLEEIRGFFAVSIDS
jgi:hypothetical protein